MNDYPVWYRRLLYSYPVSEQDAGWMYETWARWMGMDEFTR
jgi:hypothetical protein